MRRGRRADFAFFAGIAATVSRTVRVIIVNTDDDVAADLRAVLLAVDGVKIVAEIDEPALLAQAIEHFPAELLLIHLDPSPGPMMDEGGLRKIIGSLGISLPSSAAWAA